MTKLLLFLLLTFLVQTSFAQRAEELTTQSKELLNQEKFKEAIPILIEAAELGNAESQYNLGVCYQFGYGTIQNDTIATSWYLKSAEQGWTDGEYKMSYAYIKGTGIEKNEKKAFDYTFKCATKNDVECIFNLISCYTDGIGTEKDSVKVLEWAIELAKMETSENKNVSGKITSARLNLAHMFMNGKGVNKDIVKSYIWFIIYNESKSDFSVRVQEQQIEFQLQDKGGLGYNKRTVQVFYLTPLFIRTSPVPKNIRFAIEWKKVNLDCNVLGLKEP